MVFRKFFIKTLLYIILLCIMGAITLWSFMQDNLQLSRYILLGSWILLTALFIHTILQALNPLEKFFNTLQSDDLINIPARKHFLANEINSAYKYIHQILQKTKSEKEEQYHLFYTSLNHASSGIIVFTLQGEVKLMNHSARKLFRGLDFSNIHKLGQFSPDIPGFLLQDEQKKGLLKFKTNNTLNKISIQLQEFILKGEKLRIASLQNISQELEKEELLAWKNLLHVITHEIMNSVTPMKTLSYSLHQSFSDTEANHTPQQISAEQYADLKEGLSAMKNRISGMMHFVESYRKLYKIPQPKLSEFTLRTCLEEIYTLMNKELLENNIKFHMKGQLESVILADQEMITQVILNLLKNAVDAVREVEHPSIELYISNTGHEISIQVKDNGKGMDDDLLQQCFIPFYTTKESGSGIGLYYSRMIALLHKGNLSVESEPGKGSVFTLTL